MSTTEIKLISDFILSRLESQKSQLQAQFLSTKKDIGYFFIDDLLPVDLAKDCYRAFPDASKMKRLKSLREFKYVSAQLNKHDPLLEKVLYAFQDERIVGIISQICDIELLEADDTLYAGGLSLMTRNNFLNPHLDNSHDLERERWRVLNLLYYVTPDWEPKNGGHLELWPNGPKQEPLQIESKFNRLIVMATHDASWHSVNQVKVDGARCCLSNYYFSSKPLRPTDEFHITKFRARPGDTFKNLILDADAALRTLIRKFFPKGIRKNPHRYKKD